MPKSAREITSDLVAYPTVSPKGDERECANYIFDFLNDLKIADSQIDLQEFDGTRANVVATFGAAKEPGLLLSGHMDVVPAGDHNCWHSDPFRAVMRGDRLYGRGASDMKGGLASLLKAIENTTKSSMLKRRLVFAATAGEETGFVGLARLIQNSIITSRSSTGVVIGEPTDLRPARAHRGIYRIKVNFFGKASHAARPELGVNAIEYASKLIQDLQDVRQELSQTKDELLGVTTLTPTMINGGIGENVVPPNAEVVLDSRRLPVHSTEYIRSQVEKRCRELRIDYGFTELVNHKPLDTPGESFLAKLAEDITGEKAVSCAFGTEGSLYQGELG
ncbi:MAG TPA: M20/M25/M40 family metallo-hydrolase, partial [Nitrososphaerales archaeon]|nr:M20/M25/M40 family metallo-hydrolase [Nitrososphaerales archaeon]